MEDNNCNIGAKQGFLLCPTLFGICIDKLECFSKDGDYTSMTLVGIVIILLYGDNIVLLARCHSDLDKHLSIIKEI